MPSVGDVLVRGEKFVFGPIFRLLYGISRTSLFPKPVDKGLVGNRRIHRDERFPDDKVLRSRPGDVVVIPHHKVLLLLPCQERVGRCRPHRPHCTILNVAALGLEMTGGKHQ
jgi:hypothetical protein